ncbi:CbtB-domain containing protein [Williamsia sp.]|uniref:CbtB domain-containing protein n=1 Tax=Williamsia sp. TaxID=1872085 RepID=UPI001A1BB033|nr:CbtB-domain containing protein [Williamsia sp.]MBJ7288185.1 CbtB-domain containing protein [Williamsia sp.]
MSNASVATANRRAVPGSLVLDTPDISVVNTALWLTATTAVAALAYYFLGYDQGAVSVFGADTHVHEFVHDARHFLGFPCH